MSEFIISSDQLERLIEGIEHNTGREINRVVCNDKELPSIVRCRDCKWLDHHSLYLCMLPDGDGGYACWVVEPDGYCKWGEKVVSE